MTASVQNRPEENPLTFRFPVRGFSFANLHNRDYTLFAVVNKTNYKKYFSTAKIQQIFDITKFIIKIRFIMARKSNNYVIITTDGIPLYYNDRAEFLEKLFSYYHKSNWSNELIVEIKNKII